jgi:dTDP-glucose 4,6-dehydratase
MKVIITGGAGFIGGHAVQHFTSCNDEVLNIDKLTYASKKDLLHISNFVQMDIRENERLIAEIKNFNPDVLINFAAETHVDNSINSSKEFIQSNVEGVSSVLDACKATGVKLCHISTDEVYGPADKKPYFEEDKLDPKNPYSATKAASDLLVQAYQNTHNLKYLIIRPSNNYGPRQHQEKFIPKLIDCIKNQKKFPLYGLGNQEREWTYAVDTVSCIRKLLVSERTDWNSVYNISSGNSYTNLETAKLILQIFNKILNEKISIEDVIQHVKDRPGHDKKYWISTDKLKSNFDFQYTKFYDGLEKTIISYVK